MRALLASSGLTAADLTFWGLVSLRAAALLALAWAGAALLARRSAAARHQVWALGVAGALLVPLLAGALPPVALAPAPPPAPAAAAAAPDGAAPASTLPAIAGAPRDVPPQWPGWLALAWAAGAVLVSLRIAAAHAAARRIARRAAPARAEGWLRARREAAAALGMAGDVFLGRSEGGASPMTVGVWRPRVILPAAADDWSPERLRAILVHELGHVRRRDNLTQLVAQLACALYWWNPLAWLAARRLRVERELACDDLVLAAGVRPSRYAADLLEVARAPAGLAGGAVSMTDGSSTARRLQHILDASAPRALPAAGFRRTARGLLLALAAALALSSGPRPARAAAAAAEPAGERLWVGRPRPSGHVTEAVRLAAPFDPAPITTELERQRPALEACYTRRLGARPGLRGQITVTWTLMAGTAFSHTLDLDTVGDAGVRACVEERLDALRFPARPTVGGAGQVSVPLYFGDPPPADADEGC